MLYVLYWFQAIKRVDLRCEPRQHSWDRLSCLRKREFPVHRYSKEGVDD